MRKVYFSSTTEGLALLKKEYLHESDVSEGEFADWLIDNVKECFDENIPTSLVMQSIQLFRQWAHERDDLETNEFSEICSEVNIIIENRIKFNEFQDYVFFDGSFVPEGTRIGIERLHQGQMQLELDKGILFA